MTKKYIKKLNELNIEDIELVGGYRCNFCFCIPMSLTKKMSQKC